MQLQFDTARLINDIIKALNQEMDIVSKVLIEFMIGEIASMPSSGSLEAAGKPDWRLDVIDALKFRAVASAGQLVREVGVLDQQDEQLMMKAMIVEFGMGNASLSGQNPWFQEYLSSSYYHQERSGMGVYGRSGGEVYDIDTGGWKESNADSTDEIPQFKQIGSLFWTNIFGNSAIMAETYFNKGIENAIAKIDFSNYLIVK